MITGKYPALRLRRSRKNDWSRRLIEENNLTPNDFILPIFLIEGKNKKQPIKSMPGVYRYTLDKINFVVDRAIKKGLPMIALFPHIEKTKKNFLGTEFEQASPLHPGILVVKESTSGLVNAKHFNLLSVLFIDINLIVLSQVNR